MTINISLYEAEHICLGPIDFEKDPEVIARWTNDSDYLQMLSTEPALPRSAAQIKKQLEKLEKEIQEKRNSFHYTIRMRSDDRLIGLAEIRWIDWTNGNAWLKLGIGEASDRRQGYGSQALGLMLRYAFDELNLFRVSAGVQEYNEAALKLLKRSSFVEEVRRRQALHRFGRRWDEVILGLLVEDWQR